jgi:hypothetical protein
MRRRSPARNFSALESHCHQCGLVTALFGFFNNLFQSVMLSPVLFSGGDMVGTVVTASPLSLPTTIQGSYSYTFDSIPLKSFVTTVPTVTT